MFSFFKKKEVPKFPSEVIVRQVTPQDGEILEEWTRVCDKEHRAFHGIDVVKIEDDDFPWYLYFSAGEFIREEPFESELSRVIYEAIKGVKGVDDAFHEDREKFVISGMTLVAESLVREVAIAVDAFMRENLHKWENL